MVAHLARVRLHVPPPRVLVLRLERVEIRGEGRLRIDDDVLAARQLDDEVGPQHAPVGIRDRRLLGEVAVREHPRELDDALELDLAPAAAHVRRAERGAEVSGLGAELLLPLRQRLHLLGQRPVGTLALLVEGLRLLLEDLQRRRDRVELRTGELEEGVVVPLERLGGESAERGRELLRAAALRGNALAQDEPDGNAAQQSTDHESSDQHGPQNVPRPSDGTSRGSGRPPRGHDRGRGRAPAVTAVSAGTAVSAAGAAAACAASPSGLRPRSLSKKPMACSFLLRPAE